MDVRDRALETHFGVSAEHLAWYHHYYGPKRAGHHVISFIQIGPTGDQSDSRIIEGQ